MTEQYDRKPVIWCTRCRRPQKTTIYLSDHNHYCWDCAELLHRTRGLQAAGKRTNDLNPWDAQPAAG
ncbi:MAG: hypothetical protein HOH95_04700 [Dehalococcoidia bacterium]|jgi:hypothetical protein|nr:hypothetical protein [Dehalococcoidia bacterium]